MGIFSGNIGNAYKGNHVFIILDPHFQSYGVGSLTKSGFTEFVNTDFGKEVMGSRSKTNIFTALSLSSDGTYRKYDKARDSGSPYVATTISSTSLLSLIDYYESGDAQTDQKDPAQDETIKDIKNSLEGYVGFKDASGKLILKFYFNAIGKGNNERVVTQRGSPLITAPPVTAFGRKYSARQSQKIRLEETNGFPNIGTIVDLPKDADKDDVEHTVTGPMRLSWNEVTGTWDTSNQVIARLLKDLEPANIVGFELTDDDLNNTNSSTYFDKSSPKYTALRTHGTAVPLSIQNNNPDMFGPTLIKCQGANRVEEISVVNRSNDSFKNGDIVLCSFIGGEWIVQKFGSLETKPQPTSIGRWGFSKLIANSDWYFRDTDGDLTLPASCQDLLRSKFYASLVNVDSDVSASIFSKQEISTLNSINISVKVNRKLNYYIQTTSFDNSGPTKGGTGSQDFYSTINVEQPPPVGNNVTTYFETPIFWGPVFPDGYSSAGHARMRANSAVFSGWKHTGLSTASSGKPEANFGDYFFANNTTKKIQDIPNLDINDSNFLQMPADIATNGEYGGDGFPIENTHKIIQAINASVGTNSLFATKINNLINDEGFAYYLGQVDRPVSAYALKPINPLKLQFSSLCAELAGSDDANSPNLTNRYIFDRNFQKNARDPLKDKTRFDATAGEAIPASTSLFGGLYTRLAAFGISDLTTITPVTCDGVYANALVGQFQGIPYDCYIKKIPLNRPKAATFIFNSPTNPGQDGANLVGIITARNAFTKNKGGTMNISVKQMFGMFGPFIGGGSSGGTNISAIGQIAVIVSNNNPAFQGRFSPAWGSTNNDSIDSFGTTALHCMVWDYWPEQQTVFVPQYFTVLHFNPGKLFKTPNTRTGTYKPDPIGPSTTAAPGSATTTLPPIKIDIADFDVDFRIPSFNLKGSDGGYIPVIDGTVINFANTLAPEADSRINTVRRGQLVTGEGFFYYKLVIGLNRDSASITTAGKGFSKGDKIDSGKGVTIEVTDIDDNNGIKDFTFAEDRTLEGKLPAGVPLPRKRGEGFKHTDFPTSTPYKVTLKSPTGGASAVITFSSGRAYKQIKQDVGPKQRTPITRLSSSSGDGTRRIEATKNNTLNIEDNTGSKYPNKYEAFYFFHNDIGHTFNAPEIEANPNNTQYMTMTIS
jgi:hypothetical protein